MEDQKGPPPPLTGVYESAPPNDPEAPSSPHSASGDSAVDMAPSGRGRPNTPKRDVDLSSLLAPAEKAELLSLITKTTDTIQQHIIRVFDSTGIDDNAAPVRVSMWARLPTYLQDLSLVAQQRQPQSQPVASLKENVRPSDSPATPSGTTEATQNASGGHGLVEHDPGPRLQELKKEALSHFKKWQTVVHKRIGDISVKRATDVHNGQPSSSNARRGPQSSRNRQRGRDTRLNNPLVRVIGAATSANA